MENNYFNGLNGVLDKKTFIYRVNELANVCKMDNLGVSKSKFGDIEVLSGKCNRGREETKYFVTARPTYDKEFGDGITLNGYYDDLSFEFTNFYNNRDLDTKEKNNISYPFSIILAKLVDKNNFIFEIKTVNGIDEIRFKITKYREYKTHTVSGNCEFYYKVNSFDDILGVVKAFVYNPDNTFIMCQERYENKKQRVVFENDDFDQVKMEYEEINKHVKIK